MMNFMDKHPYMNTAPPDRWIGPGLYDLIQSGKTPHEIAGLLYSKPRTRRNIKIWNKRTCDLNSIINRALKVMGDRDKAMLWLITPIHRLDYATPIWLLGTRAGTEYVNGILDQIELGIWTGDLDLLGI
jgi:hypothetical protein